MSSVAVSRARGRPESTVPNPPLFRAALLALGGTSLVLGLYALISPLGFYEDFPLGRGWVGLLPSYSEHLVRDVGSLFLASAAVTIAAGIYLTRRLVLVALLSYLLYSVPHTTFHFLNFEPFASGDVIANVIGLGAQVALPIALLVMLGRPVAKPARPGARAPKGNRNGRIVGVPDSSRNPLVRYAYRESRRRAGGQVADPMRVFAHNPGLMLGYGMLELATERTRLVPDRIKHLAMLRAAMLAGCEWCLDYGSAIAIAHQIEPDDLRELPEYRDSARFSTEEKLVLDYASGISATPAVVSDELFARLRERYDEAQLVELTNIIALENYRARFNWAFGLAGQGFAEGAYCLTPGGPELSALPHKSAE